jgi:hypothetical protein
MTTTKNKSTAQIHTERNQVITKEFGSLVGKKIVKVRALTPDECDELAWDYNHSGSGFYPWVIMFDDNTCAIPSCDAEGNDSGFMFLADTSEVK